MMDKMTMKMYDAYLPAMAWLRNDEADGLQDESLLAPFSKLDRSITVSGTSNQQLAHDDHSIFAGCKSHNTTCDVDSQPMPRKLWGDTIDELFLPLEKKRHGNTRTSAYSAGRPASRHLHLAQRLPRTAKPINALPGCLVAGLQPSRTFQNFPAGSRSLDQYLGAGARPPKEIHNSAASQGAKATHRDEGANLGPCKLRTGQQRISTQTFDPVQFAQVPYHYGLCKQADEQGVQARTSLSSRIPPLRAVSPLRFSGIFPSPPTSSRNSDEIPHLPHVQPQKETHKTVAIRNGESGSLGKDVHLTSSKIQNGEQRCSTEKFNPVQFAQISPQPHSYMENINQELQSNMSLSPEIPPLRAGSPLRFSGIFPTYPRNLDPIHSLQAGGALPKRATKTKTARIEFPSSLDGSNDAASSKVQRRDSPGRSHSDPVSNLPSYEAFHKRIRRRKGYENLRMASTSYTIPPLPALSPLVFPDFSLDTS